MKIFRIPKRNGKFRTIYAPSEKEKAELKGVLAWITAPSTRCKVNDYGGPMYRDRTGVQHGFRAGHSPVTNAQQHVRHEYTLCFDLSDFFDRVTPAKVPSAPDCCFVDGAARQGLPTSPALANIAAAPLDAAILQLQRHGRFGRLFTYTRYADDLTFSFNLPHVADLLLREIPRLCQEHGFPVNPSKTHLQWAGAGRRHVTGVAVDTDLHPPREAKRRLRAARHQLKTGRIGRRTLARLLARRKRGDTRSIRTLIACHARGLAEWIKLRPPKQGTATTTTALVTAHHAQAQAPTITPVLLPEPYTRKFPLL